MKSYNHRYQVLNQYAIRVPLLPLSVLKALYDSSSFEISLWQIFNDPVISEAIYLASPDLHRSITEVIDGKPVPVKKKKNLTLSLLKYITRLCSRPTPFGLFAGTNIGNFSSRTKIVVGDIDSYSRHTRLDYEFLAMLSQTMGKSKNIMNQLRYYPNTSLYRSSNQHRFIQTGYNQGKKKYTLQNIKVNLELHKTIEFVKKGKLLVEVQKFLMDLGHTTKEVKSFIKILISKQILISTLEPYTIGTDYQDYILTKTRTFKQFEGVKFLKEFKEAAKRLDGNLGNDIEQYESLSSKALNIIPSTEKNKLIQVNLYPTFGCNHLNRKIKISLSRAVNVLSKISEPNTSNDMTQFILAFEKRYETKEIPLVNVLDLDQGIGYPIDRNKSKYPYLSGIDFAKSSYQTSGRIELNQKELFLHRQLSGKRLKRLELSEIDWTELDSKDPNLNATSYSIIQIFVKENQPQIFLKGISGSSACNLLGRFADSSEGITEFMRGIHKLESAFHNDSLIAEIAHLPENRTGNILFRPNIRDYKINFLSGVNRDNDGSIDINDLMISVRNGYLFLRSKKFGKKVVPYLSNAHSYSNSSLPIYRFLCDFQHHTYNSGLLFKWGALENLYNHLPRVSYKDVIFAKEQWVFETSNILDLLYKTHSDQDLVKAFKNWRKIEGLPQYVQLTEGDNLLLINFLNAWSIRMLLSVIRPKEQFKLVEFLCDNSVVKNSNEEDYVNEFVVAYHRKGTV